MLRHLIDLWKYRYFLWALVRLDLRQRYRRSVLGIGWSLLHPLSMTIVFTLVFGNLFGSGDPLHYAAFVMAGIATWSFLRDSLLLGCRTFQISEPYIRQSPLPRVLYTLRTVLGQLIHTVIALVVLMVLLAAVERDVAVCVRWVLLLPGLLLGCIAAWAMATLAAYATAYFNDTLHLLEVGTQLLFFLTPIMYQRALLDQRGLSWLVDINPAYVYLELVRLPLLSGTLPPLGLYWWACGFTIAAVALAAGVVLWLDKRLIFHL